jgi:sec-independent protein translocase protein TatC
VVRLGPASGSPAFDDRPTSDPIAGPHRHHLVHNYALVLPPAVRFLQGFNHGAFDALVQARDYYRFELTTMLALGAIFQLPVVMLVLGRVGLLVSATLRAKRRYAVVALAGLAAALPGTDPVTTLLELVPLLALYELSIVMLRMSERRRPSVA